MDEVPDSWMTYFEFANCALQSGMKKLAFQNFWKAYEIEPYDFIADKFTELLPEIETAVEFTYSASADPLQSKPVRFCGDAVIAVTNRQNGFRYATTAIG